MYYAGIDIGGTKSAVTIGTAEKGDIKIISKDLFPTITEEPYTMLNKYCESIKNQVANLQLDLKDLAGVGISCGGPLNSKKGMIMSPPNLPLWSDIHITDYFESAFGVKAHLHNDANACAVAEWKFGAGKGSDNVVFLTFGTGFGAGIILNGHLYTGSDDMAGEIGHIRAMEDGPEGYGKSGSFEGFCSGGGIARLCRSMIQKELKNGNTPEILNFAGSIDAVSAKNIADLADEGDEFCREVYRISGEQLGRALSVLIDLLNPDVIIIGSIFVKSENLLRDSMNRVLKSECLAVSRNRCKILPSMLSDNIGDIAALSVAIKI